MGLRGALTHSLPTILATHTYTQRLRHAEPLIPPPLRVRGCVRTGISTCISDSVCVCVCVHTDAIKEWKLYSLSGTWPTKTQDSDSERSSSPQTTPNASTTSPLPPRNATMSAPVHMLAHHTGNSFTSQDEGRSHADNTDLASRFSEGLLAGENPATSVSQPATPATPPSVSVSEDSLTASATPDSQDAAKASFKVAHVAAGRAEA